MAMNEFLHHAEDYLNDHRADGTNSDASTRLFEDAADLALAGPANLDSDSIREIRSQALKLLVDQKVLPLFSIEYLDENFDEIASGGNPTILERSELTAQIESINEEGDNFYAGVLEEIDDRFEDIAGLDGAPGISLLDVQNFRHDELLALEITDALPLEAILPLPQDAAMAFPQDPAIELPQGPAFALPLLPTSPLLQESTMTYTVEPGQGFDLIARDLYRQLNGNNTPSPAVEVALSQLIAEWNGNDRNYSNGGIHPGDTLTLKCQPELEQIIREIEGASS